MCVVQSHPHALRHLFGLRTRDVRAVRVVGKTDDFGVNLGAAGTGVLEFFQNQGTCAFADDEPVALCVKGTRREVGGVVVFRARCKKRIENRCVARVQLFAAAGDHGGLPPETDGLVGKADALRAGGAGRTRGNQTAVDVEKEADVDGGRVRHHAYVGVGIHAERRPLQKKVRHIGNRGRRARGTAVSDPHVARGDKRVVDESCVFQSPFRGAHRHDADTAHGA